LRTRLLPWRPWFSAAALEWQEPVSGMHFTDLGVLLEAAASGLGVAACTRRLAAPWIATGRLQIPFDVAAPSPLNYWMYIDANVARRPQVAAFRDWLGASLG
jgi:DNA-binding transcriptional LysR family regulator